MSANDLAAAVADLRSTAGVRVDPSRRGPVALDRLFQAANLNHAEVPAIRRRLGNCAAIRMA